MGVFGDASFLEVASFATTSRQNIGNYMCGMMVMAMVMDKVCILIWDHAAAGDMNGWYPSPLAQRCKRCTHVRMFVYDDSEKEAVTLYRVVYYFVQHEQTHKKPQS